MSTEGLRLALFKLYWRMEKVLAPGLDYSQHDYERLLDRTVVPGCQWLDLGCGHQLLPDWRRAAETSLTGRAGLLVGLDPELGALRKHISIKARTSGSASHLPFKDGSFELVTANMVVEHLAQPVEQFREIHRVLRPGGQFVFHTPNLHGHATMLARLVPEGLKSTAVRLLEGRAEEDRFPTHYRANSARELQSLASEVGFGVRTLEFVASTATFAMVPPLVIPELLWIRMTMKRFPSLRSNLLVVLERPR